jgi:hypothetical protein
MATLRRLSLAGVILGLPSPSHPPLTNPRCAGTVLQGVCPGSER